MFARMVGMNRYGRIMIAEGVSRYDLLGGVSY